MPLLVNRAFSIITSRKLVFLFRFFEMCALALGGDSVSVRASFFFLGGKTEQPKNEMLSTQSLLCASVNAQQSTNKVNVQPSCNKPISIFSSFCILNLLPFARGLLSPSIPFCRIGYTSPIQTYTQ